jgi:hypothetical protein
MDIMNRILTYHKCEEYKMILDIVKINEGKDEHRTRTTNIKNKSGENTGPWLKYIPPPQMSNLSWNLILLEL